MFEKDNQLKFQALNMWANHIETGDVCMSISDAINCGQREKINSLTLDQQKFVIRLRELATKELNSKI